LLVGGWWLVPEPTRGRKSCRRTAIQPPPCRA